MTCDFKFLSFEPTPSVQNQKGIVTILLEDKYIQRLKIVTKKDGTGSFLACANLKGEPEDGADTWRDSFELERNSVKEELHSFIRAELKKLTPASQNNYQQPSNEPIAYSDRGKGVQQTSYLDEKVPF